MLPGLRFAQWIAQWAFKWKDPVGEWGRDSLAKGLGKWLEDLEPQSITAINEYLTLVKDNPETPPEIKNLIDKSLVKGDIVPVVIGIALTILGVLPAVMGLGAPLGQKLSYYQNRALFPFRFDPLLLQNLKRRFPVVYEWIKDDIDDLGLDTTHKSALDWATRAFPSPQDAITMMAHEAFEEEMVAKYGLDDEFGNLDFEYLERVGLFQDEAKYYWRSHWQHPSFMQMMEMLHRGLLTGSKEVPSEPTGYDEWAARDAQGEKAMEEWYRLVEIPPMWRNLMTSTLWNVPTRVDVRRWWDMRTISEEELKSVYHRQGYRGKDLENYVNWTKVYTDFPMMMTRFSNGWIGPEDIRKWLRGLKIPEERIEQFIQEKTKPASDERVAEGRNFTKSEIYKGVKADVISAEEGIELLMDLGHTEAEADYLITINVEALKGSPETFAEFKGITQKYKRAIGREDKPMPEEIKKAAAEVVRLTGDVEALNRSITEELRGLVSEEEAPATATERLTELRVTLHRAEAELARVKSEYDRLVAEWKHKA